VIDDALREELSALIDGALPEERAKELLRRIREDKDLSREYAELERAVLAVRALPRRGAPPDLRARLDASLRPRRGRILRFGALAVAATVLLAVGLALVEKLQGSRNLAACFFGEGAAAEGEFHECMNLAALWKLPVLFLCENNLYAMGTALARSESQTDIQAKAAAYGVRAAAVDGMDVFAVESAVRSAAEHARAGRGPVLLELRTYRLRAHSMFDAQLYRDKAEVEEWRERGPLTTLTTRLKAAGLMTEDDFQRLLREADAEVEVAVGFATAAEWEPVEDLARHVHAEVAS